MKKLTAALIPLVAIAAFAAGAADSKTIKFAWEHDGKNVDGFQLLSRQKPDEAFTPLANVGPTNRIASVTLTNPPQWIQFTITATNAYGASDQSEPVELSKASAPTALRVVAVVTVQVP